MPDTPMPGVNGHDVSLPALQASSSISSLEPAARIVGLFALTAIAGSFCLFCENGVGGLPLLTSTSPPTAAAEIVAVRANSIATGTAQSFFISTPFVMKRSLTGKLTQIWVGRKASPALSLTAHGSEP